MMYYHNIIDVSYANGVIKWDEVSKEHVDGVIIRVGYRGYKNPRIVRDSRFTDNYAGAIRNRFPIGLYFMSQATTEKEAREEARFCISQVPPCDLDLPVYIDSEYSNLNKNGRADNLSKKVRTACCEAFCNELSRNGYEAGVYASTSWYRTHLDANKLSKYHIWCAQYNDKLTAKHRVDLWQYSSKGCIKGIGGYVDMSKITNTFLGVSTTYTPADQQNMVYWLTVADMPTLERVREVRERFKDAYPELNTHIRSARISDVNIIE